MSAKRSVRLFIFFVKFAEDMKDNNKNKLFGCSCFSLSFPSNTLIDGVSHISIPKKIVLLTVFLTNTTIIE